MLPSTLAVFLFTVTVFRGAEAVTLTLTARVYSGGVKGVVTFSQTSLNQNVTLNFALLGPKVADVKSWQFHTHRLNYDVSNRCTFENLGPRYLDKISGPITNGTASVFELSFVEGRSLALLDASSNVTACATVESTQEYVTARAVFLKNVLGHVTFRHPKSGALTQVISDLYFDGSQTTGLNVSWRVVAAGINDCASVGAAYNPTTPSGPCSTTQHSSCAVGDLSGKLGSVDIGVTQGTSRRTAVDLNLPLSAVSGHTVLLFSGTTPLACGVIMTFQTRTGVATFNNDGVAGNVTLTQPSPLDPTTTKVELRGLQSRAGGYHVHVWPVPQHLAANQALCGADNVAGHFNPFGVVVDSTYPAPTVTTDDMYEIGDLSSKYGMLNNLQSQSGTYTDWNLPLFGHNSVLGRSLVIHNSTTGAPRWVCTNIVDTAAVTVALATFTYPVIGYVMFQQRQGEEMAETSVYTRLDYGDGSAQNTSGHAWGVYADPVSYDALSKDLSTRCSRTGSVLNPYSVSNASYSTQCARTNQVRCKQGDMGGKHGILSIRTASGKPTITFNTDISLSLTGNNSIVGRSVVIMEASGGAARLSCADIIKIMPRSARVNGWGNTTYGTVSFTQISGVTQQPTSINLALSSLPASSSSNVFYTIRNRPVSAASDRCGRVGDVYNPFNLVSPTGTVTADLVPTGALSTKFGPLTQATVSSTHMDPSMDLFGPRSVVGRAMTLSSSQSEVLACGDVMDVNVQGGMEVQAEAVFTGTITGKIMLSQYVYPDGTMSDTTVVVDLRKATDPQTQSHNWHTHENPVGQDTADKPCVSTGGHYNPFMVNVTSRYDECRPDNPLRCEVGDQSNKLGTYSMGTGKMVGSDVYLPLVGKFGVVGRSIVVHAEARGAARVACANIMPSTLANSLQVRVNVPPASFDRMVMREKVASLVGTGAYDVMATVTGEVSGCANIVIYFLGLNGESNAQKFIDMMHSDQMHSILGDYTPTTCSAPITMTSLVLVLASYVLGWLLS